MDLVTAGAQCFWLHARLRVAFTIWFPRFTHSPKHVLPHHLEFTVACAHVLNPHVVNLGKRSQVAALPTDKKCL